MLLTTPLTINDGSSDRIFEWNYQVPGNVLGGVYNEPAASPMIKSRLQTLHTTAKSGRMRHQLQSSEEVALVNPGDDDPSTDGIVVNVTVAHHPKHAVADVEKRLLLALDACGAAGFTAKFVDNNV